MTQITGKTKLVGVWGHPVGHSRSPVMHNAALAALGLDWAYVPFEVAPENIGAAVAAIRALGLMGVNVTVPLKELVLPYLDEMDEDAARIGSVNTILNREGRLFGYSTDGVGFLSSLENVGQATSSRRVLILGAGGSARAVAFALARRGSHCVLTNRTQARAEALAAEVSRTFPETASVAAWGGTAGVFDLIVNTTSLGMHPNELLMPLLPPNVLASRPLVYDLIYAPPQTALLRLAAEAGCQTMNGVAMLASQGALSLALWTGRPISEIPVGVMETAVRASLSHPSEIRWQEGRKEPLA